jgi:ABC-type tungstate transport system permease subunit
MKKSIAIFLLMVMALCLFAGCGTTAPAGSEAPEESDAPAQSTVGTKILKEADDKMLNTYSVIAVNPDAPFADENGNAVSDVAVNTAGADALISWLLTQEALDMAGAYGKEQYGDTLFYVKEDAPVYTGEIAPAAEETKVIRLSTTTSVKDSGLLDYLLPAFEKAYGYTVEVQSAGTGKAIAAAKYGNADLILVHSKSQEEAFVTDGFARVVDGFDGERVSFLYNYFVLCGPSADPAGVADSETVLDAFAAIAEEKCPFVSRGDGSGTHTKELSLWPEELGITEDAASFADDTDWYISANAGMGACLMMAEEREAYILTDKATYLTFVSNNGEM